jgi:hypothetical protein
MSLGKHNREALDELFCYWYFKVYKRFPHKSAIYSNANLIKLIHVLRRKYNRIVRQEEVETFH